MQKRIRDFFMQFVKREFLVFLFFLAMSAGFWFLVTLNETYEREFRIPLQLTNVPDNVVITDPLPDSIRITVRDKVYSLLPYYYSDVLQPIKIVYSAYAVSTGKGSVPMNDLQRMVRAMLYSSTSVISIKSEKLEFSYNYGLSKRVPVLFDGLVVPIDKYYLSRTTIAPDSVLIYSTQSKLDSIKEVSTDYYSYEGLSGTMSVDLKLKKIRGVKIVPEKVRATFYADILTEKTVEVPIVAVNMPENMILRTFPGHVSIKVVVGHSYLPVVKPSNFRVEVDYNEVVGHPSDKCTIHLKTVPQGITNATLETQQVDYLIESLK